MSKEYLEAFERLYKCNDDDYTLGYQQHDYKLLQQALQRLESIDNAKPSEALECLEEMAKNRIEYSEYSMPIKDISEYKTIKQALLKLNHLEFMMDLSPNQFSCIKNREIFIMRREMYEKYQEQEKVLEIINEKHISIWRFRNVVFGYEQKQNGNNVNDTYEYYKNHFGYYHEGFEFELLDEEEFELLKRYFEKNIQK